MISQEMIEILPTASLLLPSGYGIYGIAYKTTTDDVFWLAMPLAIRSSSMPIIFKNSYWEIIDYGDYRWEEIDITRLLQ